MEQIENNIYLAKIEIKLMINKKLYEQGFLTEEMYIKAKELILKA